MELNEYANTLLARDGVDRGLHGWAHDTHRIIAWHILCLVPYYDELQDVERKEHQGLVARTLAFIDPSDPLVVPVSVRQALLAVQDEHVARLVESRTVLGCAA